MKPWSHLKKKSITGLLIVLPLVVTMLLLTYVFNKVDKYISPNVIKLLKLFGIELSAGRLTNIALSLIGLFLTFLIIYLIGLLGTNIIGKRIVTVFDNLMLRIPLIKGIYGGARQLLQTVSTPNKEAFEKVVLIQYPRSGIYAIGFATSDAIEEIRHKTEQDLISIFLPTSPNPTSGMLILVPKKDILFLDISLEEALKVVVSGGIVHPKNDKEQKLVLGVTQSKGEKK